MKPLQDYSFLKGVNHGFERDEAALRRHLGYGKRLGINSVRIWLSYKEFANEGAGYVDALRQYIRVCDSEGVTVMPILFNGNGYSEAWVEEAERRGLPNIRSMVESASALTTDKAVKP